MIEIPFFLLLLINNSNNSNNNIRNIINVWSFFLQVHCLDSAVIFVDPASVESLHDAIDAYIERKEEDADEYWYEGEEEDDTYHTMAISTTMGFKKSNMIMTS